MGWRQIAAGLALAGLIAAAYWPVREFGFVAYDDPEYVTANPVVQAGLNWPSVAWAFATGHASNWHPFTWLSHLLDIELFGVDARGPHVVNVLLHFANACLVLVLLRRLTDAWGRSVTVAVLFALHPLRVESVAWVSERKDVLCGLFFLLTLLAYERYARSAPGAGRISTRQRWYVAALAGFVCALLSKPMAVTLPFVLLLLDYWPLRRTNASAAPAAARVHRRTVLFDKVPFLILSLVAGAVTLGVQQAGGAVRSFETFTFPQRAANAIMSYARYVEKTVWPSDLAVFYPHPGSWPTLLVVAAVAAAIAAGAAICARVRSAPYVFVGVAWFVGMLVPVIGLVQVGGQAMADRYTYLPSIGLLIAMVWATNAGLQRLKSGPILAFGATLAAAAACVAATRAQLAHWRDSEALFRRAVAVTENNYVAHNNLAGVLLDRGEIDGAIQHARRAVDIRPDYGDAFNNLGQALLRRDDIAGAIENLRHAVRLMPAEAEPRNNLGNALFRRGDIEDAIACYQEALRFRPHDAKAHNNIGWAWFQAGRIPQSIQALEQAIALDASYANAHYNLAGVLAQQGRHDRAIEHLRRAAALYAGEGDFGEAAATMELCVRLAGERTDADLGESLRSQLESYRARISAHQP